MSYDDNEELEEGFKMSDGDGDEPLELPDEIPELDDDPEDRYH